MPGMFRIELAPYQAEPMNSVMDQSVQSVVLMWASQTGKTEIINNIIAVSYTHLRAHET